MNEAQLLKRLQLLKKRPDLAKELSPTELAELVVVVLGYAKNINQQIEAGKLKGEDGKTPVADKDYISLKRAEKLINSLMQDAIDSQTKWIKKIIKGEDGKTPTREEIMAIIDSMQIGKNVEITPELVSKLADRVTGLIDLPKFNEIINRNPDIILKVIKESKLKIDDIENLPETIEGLEKKIDNIKTQQGGSQGGTNKNLIRAMIEEYATSTVDSVNGQTGTVVLDADDIDDTSTTQKFVTAGDLTKLSNLSGTNTGDQDLSGYQLKSEKGANNGYASLDSGGKIPVSQLPSSLMEYQGTWNASTNSPTLIDGTGNNGDVYLVSTGGTQNLGSGSITFSSGDWVVYNGSIWEKSINSNAVVSVNGQTGVVTIPSATTTAEGLVELAITSEVNTGTDTTRAVTPDALSGSYAGTKSVSIEIFEGTTDVTTGDGKAYITIPSALNGMNLVRATATVVTAGTTNATTIMVHNLTDAVDMLSGAISIASASVTATEGTINTSNDDVTTNDRIRIDVDSVSTTAPKGLQVVLEFRLP